MKKKAIFPGSFDPITIGHIEIVEKSLMIFDEIIIAIGTNPEKKYMFTESQRLNFIIKYFNNKKNVKVVAYDGLTFKLCKKIVITKALVLFFISSALGSLSRRFESCRPDQF